MNPPSSSSSSSLSSLDRRTFVKTLSAAGLGVAVGAVPNAFAQTAPATAAAPRKRYAIVGVGGRHSMYHDAIQTTHKAHAELVAICDTNPGRMEVARARSQRNGATPPPAYLAADFKKMIAETKPDVVIVTTIDATHDDYIVAAMEAGCDTLTEKPMTTDAAKVRRIVEARQRTGRRCRVAFNYRYSPSRTQVKEMLMNGDIGEILSADFHWMLNTSHGADYFRRWHAHKKFSGGLMVHKASHHFDLVNWWFGSMPVSVYATGKRDFYTPQMAKRMGLSGPHERCHTCPEKAKCSFHLDMAASNEMRSLYLEQEKHDGYFRDRCVFRPEIDIEDTMNVLVKYDNGATLAYSLNAFNSWEGYQIVFNGTKGRIEHSIIEKIYADPAIPNQGENPLKTGTFTRIHPLRGVARDITPIIGRGGHDGGDPVMLDDIFLPQPPADKYLRASDERAGAASSLIGIAANQCFQTGQLVKIADLVPNLVRPDYAPMPTREQPLPMPSRTARQV